MGWSKRSKNEARPWRCASFVSRPPGKFRMILLRTLLVLCGLVVALHGASAPCSAAPASQPAVVDATTIRGRVMCGYQGWFRCPGDAAGVGWVHWSRDGKRVTPQTLTLDMW